MRLKKNKTKRFQDIITNKNFYNINLTNNEKYNHLNKSFNDEVLTAEMPTNSLPNNIINNDSIRNNLNQNNNLNDNNNIENNDDIIDRGLPTEGNDTLLTASQCNMPIKFNK